MKQHKTIFGKTVGAAWDWIKDRANKLWQDADHDALQWAVLTTQALKEGLKSGILSWIVDATDTGLDNDIVAFANKQIPILLADLLLLQGVKNSENETDIEAVAEKVMDSFGVMSDGDKSEFYTRFGSKLYILWQQEKAGKKVTFGQAAHLLEDAFQEYLSSKKK